LKKIQQKLSILSRVNENRVIKSQRGIFLAFSPKKIKEEIFLFFCKKSLKNA
jgi:hypothetical protein